MSGERPGLTSWWGFATLLYCSACVAGLDEGLDALRKGDYGTAARELKPLADKGDSEAQYRLGLMYEFGKGFPQDKALAVGWLKRSATTGNPSAQQELGVIYATGDGVQKDDAQAVVWFRKAAEQEVPAAQYNLALMLAKGAGIRRDDAQAIAWFRKAADQGYAGAQFKLGVAYENGEGVAADPVAAYANYTIAARGGSPDAAARRDDVGTHLSAAQKQQALAMASGWSQGHPMPGAMASAPTTDILRATGTPKVSAGPPHVDQCVVTGMMEGEKFATTHCTVSLYGDQHSVAIWFNEDPVTPAEAQNFQTSSYAGDSKDGKRRTMLTIMFCPGGGEATAAPAAVKAIDFNTSNATSALAGVQWSLAAPKDFKVDKMAGDLKPGGVLTGKISGSRARTTFAIDFDVTLPSMDAAAGMRCGK
jgi:TPR repeat protein